MGSEATAAAAGQPAIRRDPFAMLPFCGYNMANYWSYWLEIGAKLPNPPRIFRVNWFRRDEYGQFMWPGFSENMRVLQWIVDRVHGRAPEPVSGPLGLTPHYKDINWAGLSFPEERFQELMAASLEELEEEAHDQSALFNRFGDALPVTLEDQRQTFIQQLHRRNKGDSISAGFA
jgi:phosphoenolpyruvate carboxykinase (GTP)